MKWIWNHCRRRQDASLLAAGALAAEERKAMESHLAICPECRAHYHEIRVAAAPWVGWEKNLTDVEVTPAARQRWAAAVREAAAPAAAPPPLLKNAWRIVWTELIRPNRHAWAGMAALWLVMLAVNGQWAGHRPAEVGATASAAPDLRQAWEEQNRILAELTQPAFAAPAPAAVLPRPRSEADRDWEFI